MNDKSDDSWLKYADDPSLLDKEAEEEKQEKTKKIRKPRTKKTLAAGAVFGIRLTTRDGIIEKGIDRFGVLNAEQIKKWVDTHNSDASGNVSIDVIKMRLSKLTRAGRLKTWKTQFGTYYSLTNVSAGENQLIKAISLDRLEHEDWCREIVLDFPDINFLTSREIRARIVIGQKIGPIPDLVVLDDNLDWEMIVEYERTRKSTSDAYDVIKNWIESPRRQGAYLAIVGESAVLNMYKKILEERFKWSVNSYVEQTYVKNDIPAKLARMPNGDRAHVYLYTLERFSLSLKQM